MRPCDHPGEPEPGHGPDAAGFTALFNAHFHRVYVNLRRLGVPEAAVDDALQEVFIVVLRRRGEQELLSERAWILGVTRRIAHRWRRSAARQRRLAEALGREPHEPLDGASAVAQQQATRLLEGFLGRLDDDKRAVFVLAELEQLTAPEIAEALQLNLNTVYSRLRAARQVFDRSFARARVRDARTTGEPLAQATLLSHARAAYAPDHRAQARALALLAPLLLAPSLAHAADALPALHASVSAGKWIGWTATLGLAGALTAGVLADPPAPDRSTTDPITTTRTTSREASAALAEASPEAPPDTQAITTQRPADVSPARGPSPSPIRRPRAPEPRAPELTPGDASPTPQDPLQREAALLAQARTALRSADPTAAQALLDRHAREFPDGALTDERRLSQISVICLSGQVQRARDEAERLALERPATAARAAALCREFSATDGAGSGD